MTEQNKKDDSLEERTGDGIKNLKMVKKARNVAIIGSLFGFGISTAEAYCQHKEVIDQAIKSVISKGNALEFSGFITGGLFGYMAYIINQSYKKKLQDYIRLQKQNHKGE